MATAKKKKNIVTSPEKYLEFLKKIKIKGVGLDMANVQLNRPQLAMHLAAKEDLPITLNTHFSVLHHEDSSFVIGAGFELIQSKPDKKDKPVLTIAMSFSALFEEASKNDGDWINRFSQGEARLIFWPYLRYFVSDMTSRMSINPIVIPLTSQLDEAKPKK